MKIPVSLSSSVLCLCAVAVPVTFYGQAQSSKEIQTVRPYILQLLSANPASAALLDKKTPVSPMAPANFHAFGSVRDGKPGEPHELTIGFTQATAIIGLKITSDFRLLDGGTCAEGQHYGTATSCTVLVQFTPHGPGIRSGKLTVDHTAATHPETVSLEGSNYSAAISFIPALITTLPATYNSVTMQGNLVKPPTLTTDSADNLYIGESVGSSFYPGEAGIVYIVEPNGSMSTLVSGNNENRYPESVTSLAADLYGNIFFVEYLPAYEVNEVDEVDVDGSFDMIAPCTSQGSDNNCTYLVTNNCYFFPFSVVPRPDGQLYAGDNSTAPGDGLSDPIWLLAPTYTSLYGYVDLVQSIFSFDAAREVDLPLSLALDSNGYLFYSSGNYCQARSVNPVSHEISIVAGTQTCGFGGDGGPSREAMLNRPQEVAVDRANNLYIADTGNQVIRRIDALTGIIHTIAGIPSKPGYTGDNGLATAATLNAPQGVAVNSNGDVFIADTNNNVVRQVGPDGSLIFSGSVGVATPIQTINISNTGTSELNVTSLSLTGSKAADFSTSASQTTCPFVPKGTGFLAVGQSCTIGITFKPSVIGLESAVLSLASNTDLNTNTIRLTGSGQKLAPVVTWPTPTAITTLTALSATQLDAKAAYGGKGLTGTFAYAPAAGTTLAAGTQTLSVLFTPTDTALYSDTLASVKITINAVAPTLTWSPPASITTTTPLSSKQLDATATMDGKTVPGTFVYTPPAGTVFGHAGPHTLSATFTPVDTMLYGTGTISVSITVTSASVKPTVTLTSNKNPGVALKPITFTVFITNKRSIKPTGTVRFFDGETQLGATSLKAGTAQVTLKNLTAGSHLITAVYDGDQHFIRSNSRALLQRVLPLKR